MIEGIPWRWRALGDDRRIIRSDGNLDSGTQHQVLTHPGRSYEIDAATAGGVIHEIGFGALPVVDKIDSAIELAGNTQLEVLPA